MNRLPQSYAKVADTLGVYLCTGCGSRDHRRGWEGDGTVHWGERSVTRPGLRRFLMLAADAKTSTIPEETRRKMPEIASTPWSVQLGRMRYASRIARKKFHVQIIPSPEDIAYLDFLLWKAASEDRKTARYRLARAWIRRWRRG